MNPVDEFIARQKPEAAAWLADLAGHMRTFHPDIPESIWYGMPTWKLGKRDFICLSCHGAHFTIHTLDYGYLEDLRRSNPASRFGKGSFRVDYADKAMRMRLYAILDDLVTRMKSHS
jgi:uncharacterized protein YdhG (YjbR/CyaY superfamily)